MKPTPRTDAAVIASGFQAVPFGFQDFARTLETQVAAAQTELAQLRAENLVAHQMACAAGLERDSLRVQVEKDEAEVELDEDLHALLEAALKKAEAALAAEREKVRLLREALDEAQSRGRLTGVIFNKAREALDATEEASK